jgi:hypothetical protein
MSEAERLTIEQDIVREAERIITESERQGILLRLVGGLAIYLTSPKAAEHPRLKRSYADLDVVGLQTSVRKIKELFIGLGYQPDQRFNALHGSSRLIFYDLSHHRHVDVFLDYFRMCHTLDLRQRLLAGRLTIPLVDLLVTKLQVRQLNAKDVQDILAILLDHELSNEEQENRIDLSYLCKLTSCDWGLYTSVSDSLRQVCETMSDFLQGEDQRQVLEKIGDILQAMQNVPKSTRWKLRAIIGRRVEWFDLPDEVNR